MSFEEDDGLKALKLIKSEDEAMGAGSPIDLREMQERRSRVVKAAIGLVKSIVEPLQGPLSRQEQVHLEWEILKKWKSLPPIIPELTHDAPVLLRTPVTPQGKGIGAPGGKKGK